MHNVAPSPTLSSRWTDSLAFPQPRPHPVPRTIGILKGEGIGPEVVGAALQVLDAITAAGGVSFTLEYGTAIGRESEQQGGKALPDDVVDFCRSIFARGGAILNGPGGGRYVYDLRRSLDLYCKLSPIRVAEELLGAIRIKPEHARGVDILMVRENSGGLYQGTWTQTGGEGGRQASQAFHYAEATVDRILWPAARLALTRRGQLCVVVKESGVPAISELWRDRALDISRQAGVACSVLDIDHIAYRLIQHPQEFDVIAAPNLFGDVLSDLGGVLLGSRGLCYAASFSGDGAAVYQTNHGAAYDLAGTDKANPVAQILSLAMMLQESFHRPEEAACIERAVAKVWREGWRTSDLAEPGCRTVGTRQMAELICAAVPLVASFSPAAVTLTS